MSRTGLLWTLGFALASAPAAPLRAQGPVLPADTRADSAYVWFSRNLDFLTRDGGVWLTDNSRYMSADESWGAYGIEWRKGVSGRTGRGRLFGVGPSGAEQNFWEFLLYWDPHRRTAVALQVHTAGGFGLGDLTWSSPTEHELVQTFHWPDGSTPRVKHHERASNDSLFSQSFDWKDGTWLPRRTYVWTRRPGGAG